MVMDMIQVQLMNLDLDNLKESGMGLFIIQALNG